MWPHCSHHMWQTALSYDVAPAQPDARTNSVVVLSEKVDLLSQARNNREDDVWQRIPGTALDPVKVRQGELEKRPARNAKSKNCEHRSTLCELPPLLGHTCVGGSKCYLLRAPLDLV